MTKVTSYAALKPKEKLQLWQYEPEPLKNDEIEVQVTHNGLCNTDIHMRDNDWGVSEFPLVAGHEVVGIVADIGKDVTNLKSGDRVGLGWIRDSCRVCSHCLQGEENVCKQGFTGLIVGNHGGFADKDGILCFLGIPVSSINVPLIPLIFGQKSVVGSVVGGRRFMQEMLDFAAINQIKPMVETMPLSRVNEAIELGRW